MRRLILLAAATASLVASACGRDAQRDPSVVRADSAGVRVVTSTGPDRPLAWTFEEIGALLDSTGEPFLFDGLTNKRVVIDRIGRTYVLTSEPSIIRFGRDGKYELAVGRRGGAPGEMQFPVELVIQGDSLAVFDPMRGALVRFGPDLAAIADVPLREGLTDVTSIAFRSGGVWVERSRFEAGATWSELFSDTMTSQPMLAVPGVPTRGVSACGGAIRISLPKFFTPDLHWSTDRGHLLASAGVAYELRLFEGPRLKAILRRPLTPRVPTADDVRRLYPNGMRARYSGGVCEFDLDALAVDPGLAEQMPFVQALALLADGTIWVQRSLRGESPSVVDAFTSDGAYAGTKSGVMLPVVSFPNGELLVPRADTASGGQHLVRFRVTRQTSSASVP